MLGLLHGSGDLSLSVGQSWKQKQKNPLAANVQFWYGRWKETLKSLNVILKSLCTDDVSPSWAPCLLSLHQLFSRFLYKLDQFLQNQCNKAFIIDSFSLTAPCLKDALTYHIILGPILSRAHLYSSVTFLPSWLGLKEPGAFRAWWQHWPKWPIIGSQPPQRTAIYGNVDITL